MNKIKDLVYPIIRILRKEIDDEFVYSVDENIVIITGIKKEIRIKAEQLAKQSEILLDKIKQLQTELLKFLK